MSDPIVKVPTTCICGRFTGRLTPVAEPTAAYAGAVICECGKIRAKLSAATMRWHDAIASKFGAPTEVILRSPAAKRAIEVQDQYLQTRHGRDGRSLYDIVSANLNGGADVEPPIVDDGIEVDADRQ